MRFRRHRVRSLRAERKLTQLDLATLSDLGLATIARIEREYVVSIETAKAICAALNIDLSEIADVVDVEANHHENSDIPQPQFFEIMMKELGEAVGNDQAEKVMNKLFDTMRRFPFGKYNRDDLYKLKKYDTDGLIQILRLRASAIQFHLSKLSDGRLQLIDPAGTSRKEILPPDSANKLATEWSDRFTTLHNEHIDAIKNGHLLAAHEIRQAISELLEMIYRYTKSDFRWMKGVYSSS